jgi:hypothetical protein
VLLRDNDGAYRQTLTINGSGISGQPITIKADTGESPVIKTTTAYTYGSNLYQCYVSGNTRVYGAELATSYTAIPVADDVRIGLYPDDNECEESDCTDDVDNDADNDIDEHAKWDYYDTMESGDTTTEGASNCSTIAATLIDGTFHHKWGDNSFYYRKDGVSAYSGTLEIAVREKAIDLQDNDYIVIDGIELYGGVGNDTGFATWSEMVQIRADDEADNNTLQNVTHRFAYHAGYFGDVDDLVLTNIVIKNSRDGYYFSGAVTLMPGEQTSGPVTITNMYCRYLNQVYPDTSDAECIGLKNFHNVDISNSFFADNTYKDDPDDGGNDPVTLMLVYDSRVHNNYFYRCGGLCLSISGNSTGGSAAGSENTQVDHNVFDSWGINPHVDVWESSETAVKYADGVEQNCVGVGNPSSCCSGVDPSDPCVRGGGYLKNINNLYINGPTTTRFARRSALHLSGDLGVSTNPLDITISNNVFEELGSTYAIYEDIFAWNRVNTFTMQNNYARKATGNLIYGDGDTTFDYRYFSDTVTSGTDYEDALTARGFTASGNVDETDPELISTTAGPGNNKSPASGSPLIDNGIDLGTLSGLSFSGTDFTTIPPIVATLDQDDYGTDWEIGAFVYSGTTFTFYIDQDGGTDVNCTAPETASHACSAVDGGGVPTSPCQTTKCADELIANATDEDTLNIYFECGDTWTVAATNETIQTNNGRTTKLSSYEGASLGVGCSGALPTLDANDTDIYGTGFNQSILYLYDDSDTVEYLRFEECYGRCIYSNGDPQNRDMRGAGPTIQYNEVEQAGWHCINFWKDAGAIIQYNDVSECGYGGDISLVDDRDTTSCTGPAEPWKCCTDVGSDTCNAVTGRFANHPQGIGDGSYDFTNGGRATIRGNRVSNSWTEGIQAASHTVEENVVWNTHSVALYINPGSGHLTDNTTVRKNLVFTDSDDQADYCSKSAGGKTDWCGGITINNEGTPGVDIRNNTGTVLVESNIVAGGSQFGITINNTRQSIWSDIDVFNNTVIDCRVNFYITNGDVEAEFLDVDWKNNVSYVSDENDDGGTDYCAHAYNPMAISSNFDFDYNAWHCIGDCSADTDSDFSDCDFTDCTGCGNDQCGDTKLGKTSGWLTQTSIPPTSDLIPGPVSIVIDNGLDLGTGRGLNHDNTDFTTIPPTVATLDQDDYGTGWEIGAFVFSTTDTAFYVRPSGGAYGNEDGSDYANAWDGFSNIDWGLIDLQNGRLFVCGTHRETMTTGASGESEFPIQIVSCTIANGASNDDPGIILLSDAYDYTDWGDTTAWWTTDADTTCEDAEVCIYRFADAALPSKVYSVARSTDGGTTYARTAHVSEFVIAYNTVWSAGDIQSNLDDEEFYWDRTNEYAYFRCDYATCGAGGSNLGLFEMGGRLSALNIDHDYITVDGLTFKYGGGGETVGPDSYAAIVPDGDNLVIQNCTFEDHFFWGIRSPTSGISDGVFQNNVFKDGHSGLAIKGSYDAHVPGSQTNSNITITKNTFTRISGVADDAGDAEALGAQAVSYLTINENYFNDNGYTNSMNLVPNMVAIVWSEDVTIEHNYFYKCGHSCISWGIGTDALSTSNLYIRHNVFDSWGYYAASDLSSVADVHALGNINGYWVTIKANDPNDDDHGYIHEITNNLFINGPDILGSHTNSEDDDSTYFSSSLAYYTKFEMSNNIFHNNNSYHEMHLGWHWDTPKAQIFIENNYIYDTSGSEVINLVDGDYSWAHDKIIGGADTFWDWEWTNERGFTAGNNDNNVDADPELVSTTAGPSNNKSPAIISPLIDAGKDLGTQDGILFSLPNYEGTPIVVNKGDQDPNWEIGPFGFINYNYMTGTIK